MTGITVDQGETYKVVLFSTGQVKAIPIWAEAPAVPTGLARTVRINSVKVTWTPVSGAFQYVVYRNGAQVAVVTQTSSFVDTNVTIGQTYTYSLQSADSFGLRSVMSSSVSAFIDPALNVAPTVEVRSWPTSIASGTGRSSGSTPRRRRPDPGHRASHRRRQPRRHRRPVACGFWSRHDRPQPDRHGDRHDGRRRHRHAGRQLDGVGADAGRASSASWRTGYRGARRSTVDPRADVLRRPGPLRPTRQRPPCPPNPITLSHIFTVQLPCRFTGCRIYKAPNATATSFPVKLWSGTLTGTLVASRRPSGRGSSTVAAGGRSTSPPSTWNRASPTSSGSTAATGSTPSRRGSGTPRTPVSGRCTTRCWPRLGDQVARHRRQRACSTPPPMPSTIDVPDQPHGQLTTTSTRRSSGTNRCPATRAAPTTATSGRHRTAGTPSPSPCYFADPPYLADYYDMGVNTSSAVPGTRRRR